MDQLNLSSHTPNKAIRTKDLYDVVFDSFIDSDCPRPSLEFQEEPAAQDFGPLFGTPLPPGIDEPSDLSSLAQVRHRKLLAQADSRNLDTLFCLDLYSTIRHTSRSHSSGDSMTPSDEMSSCSGKDTPIDCWSNSNSTHIAPNSMCSNSSMVEMAVPTCSSQYRTDSWVRRIEANVDKYGGPTNTPQQIPPTPPIASSGSSHWQQTASAFDQICGDYFIQSPQFNDQNIRLQSDYSRAHAAQTSQLELPGSTILQQSPTPPDSRTPSFQDVVFSPNAPTASTFTTPESDGDVAWDHPAHVAYEYKLDASPAFNFNTVQTWWPPTQHSNPQLLSQTHAEPHAENTAMYSGSGLNFASHVGELNPNGHLIAWEDHLSNSQVEHYSWNTYRRPSVLKSESDQTDSPISPTSPLQLPKSRESRTPSPAHSRRSKTKKAQPGGSRRGKSVTGNRNNNNNNNNSNNTGGGGSAKMASAGFVNFTPDDSQRILTGVAPSGSSKTKARREKEQADKRRRMSMAAAKAVLDAGGNLESLEKLEKEGHFSWDFAAGSSF